jgi:predicted nucleotide-binding protein (sugar kinase/HSP70/actin superfamily)
MALEHSLAGRRLYIPRMGTASAEAIAAAFRSAGVDARVVPPSDDNTLSSASRFVTGEECLPQRVTLGDFLAVIQKPGFDPKQNAFFMPTSFGPCRFGQYAPLFRKILKGLGMDEAVVFSPTSSAGYADIAGNRTRFLITAWRSILSADLLRKVLLMTRPYEKNSGESDRIHDECLEWLCAVFADPNDSLRVQMRRLIQVLEETRDRFLTIPLAEERGSRPLVGMVGEIFLRFNAFSNQRFIRRVEAKGGEVWIAGISEWMYYTNLEQMRNSADNRRMVSLIGAKIRHAVQRRDERLLNRPFKVLFSNRHEHSVEHILKLSRPYLPQEKALGEMTLNAGNAVAFHESGCDGVADVSPFTCMNGIVTEAVYPTISRDLGGFPIRIFYFDGVPFDIDSDLDIFMELVRGYRRRSNNHDIKNNII